MTSEISILTAAHDHQADLLAEADARRLTRRSTDLHADSPLQPARRRLTILLRRLAGAPTVA